MIMDPDMHDHWRVEKSLSSAGNHTAIHCSSWP